jgi:hypothetical protein
VALVGDDNWRCGLGGSSREIHRGRHEGVDEAKVCSWGPLGFGYQWVAARVRVVVRNILGRGGDMGRKEPVSCEEDSVEMEKRRRPGPEWDVTDEWVGCEGAEEGVEIRGRYTQDDQGC